MSIEGAARLDGIDARGGDSDPRPWTDSAPGQPVLLVGPESEFESSGVMDWLSAHSWSSVSAADADRAKWLVCIQRISLVLVAGDQKTVWPAVDTLRPVTTAPMVVLAAPSGNGVVQLVSAGVDGVIDPTCGPDEIFARVVALLRRLDHTWEPGIRYLISQDLRLDLWSQQCESAGRPLHLSPTEYALLAFLMTRANQALAAQTIVRKVWGWPPSDGRNALRIFVNRLRRKIGDDSQQPRFIEAVRGTGYRFVGNVTELGDTPQGPDHSAGTAPLFDSLERLAVGLLACTSVGEATDSLLQAVDSSGYADAMAMFRLDGSVMHLIDHRHCPEIWVDQVKSGVPLCHTFASAHSVLTGETVCFGDISAARERFSSTAQNLMASDLHAAMFLPIVNAGKVWGNLGVVRRARQPFDATGASYLRSAVATFTLALEKLGR
jgi:two-component system KDP operon response regulator KdpE